MVCFGRGDEHDANRDGKTAQENTFWSFLNTNEDETYESITSQ